MENLVTNSALVSFSARLKSQTALQHQKAEKSTFMQDLLGGKLSVSAYIDLLGQYWHIYGALEKISAHYRKNPSDLTDPFVQEGLDRQPSISADLTQLGSVGIPEALPATSEYVAVIGETLAFPERFLAHHYLRYLGDLSGGQVVAVLLQRHYGVSAEALSMYRFPDLPKPKVFKDSYRGLLDAAPLTALEQESLIQEAVKGFDLSAALFAQLEESVTY